MFCTWKVLQDRANTMDRLKRKLPSLVGSFCCILCWMAEEDLDYILCYCEFVSSG